MVDGVPKPQRWLLIIGNARSGSTLLGSLINAHPQAIIANESAWSGSLLRPTTRGEVVDTVLGNAWGSWAHGREAGGYRYPSGGDPWSKAPVLVMGEKVWNPVTLLLHGIPGRIGELEEMLGAPVVLVDAVRNPFNVISTMHRRSGASIADRTRWYRMHCDAVAALEARVTADRLLHVFHEDVLADPQGQLSSLCTWLGLPVVDRHLDLVAKTVDGRPQGTSGHASWTTEDLLSLDRLTRDFPWLERYAGAAISEAAPS